MGISNQRFTESYIYFDYSYEAVMFRYDFQTKKFLRKFYDEVGEVEVPFHNSLLSEAIRLGVEIDKDTYLKGKAN